MATTHIGCIADTPQRTLAAIKSADLLVFEEDKPGKALLKAAGIRKTFLKYSEHDENDCLKTVKNELLAGKQVVYCSDQGSPTLADPGRKILEIAYALDASVTTIPGPSSVTAAISACPFDLTQFYFAGFGPRKSEERNKWLQKIDKYDGPLIILDAPYRLQSLVQACSEYLRPNRRGFLAINISYEDESFLLTKSLKDLSQKVANLGKKNFVLICSN